MRLLKATLYLISCGMVLTGCGDHNPTAPRGSGGSAEYSLLPPSAYLDSAKLVLHTCQAQGQVVVVHPQTTAWSENTASWDLIGSALSPFVLATFRPHDTGWVRVDVTGLLKLWLDGTWANHGVVLDQNAPEYLRTVFESRETRSRGPRLILYYSVADSSPVFNFSASADAMVDAASPSANFGTDSLLQTGWTSNEPGERRALIAFDLLAPQAEPISRLGDRVWLDADADGVQDDSEPGFAGAHVSLLDCSGNVLAETISDSSGQYLFDSLQAGSYAVHVLLPVGYDFTTPNGADSDLLDSDVDPESGRTDCCSLAEGVDNLSYDAGLVAVVEPEPKAAVGDRVWLDIDADGLQAEAEPGMAGLEVVLMNCDQVVLASTFTDQDGHFQFAALDAGTYRLRFSAPEGFEFSPQVSSDWAANSDADPATGLSECFELSAGEEDWTRDAGLHEPAPEPVSALGDRVWLDENRDGVQDESEGGVADVEVVLLNCDLTALADTRTDAFGQYRFDSLPAGAYRVRFAAPEGMVFVPRAAGGDPGRDNDADSATGLTDCFELPAGEVDLSWDAGLCVPEPEPSGCTRSRCFWKEHSGRQGDPDWVSPHLPIWLGSMDGAKSVLISQADSAGRLLSFCIMGGYENGITRLYAELLTARLNEAEGASPAAIQSVLESVDAFLAGVSWQNWCGLSSAQRCQVAHWREALADWNNGVTGPGACPN